MTALDTAVASLDDPARHLVSPTRLRYPDAPVWQILAGAARRWPQRDALIQRGADCGEAITWDALWRRSLELAGRLDGAGLRPGDVLGVQLRNSIEMAVVYWAGQLAGLAISPVNPLQPVTSIAHQLDDAGAAAVVREGEDGLVLEPHGAAAARNSSATLASLLGSAGFTPYTAPDLSAAVAHISYTGGTTGTPKGVLISQRALVCNVLQFAHWVSSAVPRRDRAGGIVLEQSGSEESWPIRLGTGVVAAGAPWFHAMGLGGGLVVPALLGHTSLLLGRFDPATFLDTVAADGLTSISGAPAMLAALVREQEANPREVSSVRLVSCGGGPLPAALADRLAAAFPRAVVTQAYGLTEVTMAAVGCPTDARLPRHTGRAGVPMADTEVLLVPTPEYSGPGGEIFVRGPQLMLGYHGRPAETADVLRDGWLRTGDIGVVDENGMLVVVDRSKDMLLFKGYNVYPSELEALLREQRGVRDAAVVGAPHPDDGEHPVAFVVSEADGLDVEAIRRTVNERVVHYKRLHAVHVIDALPVSPLGKVLKGPLRAEAARLAEVGA